MVKSNQTEKAKKLTRERDNQAEINHGLDRIDQSEDVTVDRVYETLQIDGETHPPKCKVKEEIGNLHGRKHLRHKSPKPEKPIPGS